MSKAPADWERLAKVHGEALQEVLYDKARGEGMAKVGSCI